MTNNDFQLQVIQSLAEIKTKQDDHSNKLTQLFTFHNVNQEKINKIDTIEINLKEHEKNHFAFRLAAMTAIMTGLVKAFWPSKG